MHYRTSILESRIYRNTGTARFSDFSFFGGQQKGYLSQLKCLSRGRRVARNSQWGGGLFGGLGAMPPAAGGWGLGGKDPSRRRHGGLGAEPPALENFAFFAKINSF